MEIYFKTEENTGLFSTNKKQIVELRGLTLDEVEKIIKFYNDLKAAKEQKKSPLQWALKTEFLTTIIS